MKTAVIAKKAIMFKCLKCKSTQFSEYTLELNEIDEELVYSDHILCGACGYDNFVVDYERSVM